VLTLTPAAESVINDLLSDAASPQANAVRIESDSSDGGVGFRLLVVDRPEPGDQPVEGSAPIFVAPDAALLLDEAVLGVTEDEEPPSFWVSPRSQDGRPRA
jgi:hypothetical protein